MKKPGQLRDHLFKSSFTAMLVLWAVLMALLTGAEMRRGSAAAVTALGLGVNGAGSVPAGGVQDKWRVDWRLKVMSLHDGGMVYRVYDGDGRERAGSALALGMAEEKKSGYSKSDPERIALDLDRYLDDAGQIAFARWVRENRGENSGFELIRAYRKEDDPVALVSGVKHGDSILVRRLALRYPDGREEVVVDTGLPLDEAGVLTREYHYIWLDSALLQGPGILRENASDSDGSLRVRLNSYHRAERMAERLGEKCRAAGEPVRLWEFGGTAGYTVPDKKGGCGVIAWSTPLLRNALKVLWPVYIATLLATLVLAWAQARRQAKRLAAPVERLCGAVAEGRPCEQNGSIQELDILAVAFNAAQKRLSDDLDRQRELTRAVAHELKTPAAVLRSYAEGLAEDIAPERREEYLHVLMEESDRMGALVGQLLEFSRLEQGRSPLELESVDLAGLTAAAFRRLELPMEQRGLTLELELAPVTLSADPARLGQALDNLAANALRYADPGVVAVRLTAGGGLARLSVENACAPIGPEAMEHLFEPFYRPDRARSRALGGSGLGLAIVANVVKLHGGTCGAEGIEGGVRFWVELPVEK